MARLCPASLIPSFVWKVSLEAVAKVPQCPLRLADHLEWSFQPLTNSTNGAHRTKFQCLQYQWEKACPEYLRNTLKLQWKFAHDTDLLDAVAVHDAIARVYECVFGINRRIDSLETYIWVWKSSRAFITGVFGSESFAEWHVPTLKVLARGLAKTAWQVGSRNQPFPFIGTLNQ